MRILVAFFAFGLICFGLIMVLGGALLFFDEESKYGLVETIIMISFLGALPIGVGCFLGLHSWRGLRSGKRETQERKLLQLAASRGGTLSLAEVTAFSQMDSKHAEALLEDLHRRGIAEMRVTDGGAMVYHFPGFLSEDQKNNAEGY